MSTHFATAADGTRLAWNSVGQGQPLVFVNGLSTSTSYYRHIIPHFQERARIITWDFRGHGASAPTCDLESLSIPAMADDLYRVLEAAEVDRGVLIGFSLGCQIVIEAWRHFPDRISAMVPILGTAGHIFDEMLHPSVGPLIARTLRACPPTLAQMGVAAVWLGTRIPGAVHLSRATGVVGASLHREDVEPYFAELRRLHGPTYARLAAAAQEHSAVDLLETITVPTLVIAGGRDIFTPPQSAKLMAASIPHAELEVLPEAGHTGTLEFPEVINQRLEAFLYRHQLLDR